MTTLTSQTNESSIRGGYVRESSVNLGTLGYFSNGERGMALLFDGLSVSLHGSGRGQEKEWLASELVKLTAPIGGTTYSSGWEGVPVECASCDRQVSEEVLAYLISRLADWEGLIRAEFARMAGEFSARKPVDFSRAEKIRSARLAWWNAFDARRYRNDGHTAFLEWWRTA